MTRKNWKALDLTTLPDCVVIAADPSLAAFGLVFFEVNGGQVYIRDAHKFETHENKTVGWQANFDRALDLNEQLYRVLDHYEQSFGYLGKQIITHEAPPAGGGTIMRPESSVLAGMMFQHVVQHRLAWDMDELVTPQSMKSLICGNHIAKKKEVHDAIRNLLPFIHDEQKVKNEATRDALGIGLYAAHRLG